MVDREVASLYERAKQIIPGGTQLLSKRPELYAPDYWPAYYDRAEGCRVTLMDGRVLIDFSTNGIGATVLGANDPDVNEAVIDAIRKGSMSSLNVASEIELAELLIDLEQWPEAVRFARSGGEALAMAIRIARAFRQRDVVLFCGYHGWHDWYLAANLSEKDVLSGHLLKGLSPLGVPQGLRGTAVPFKYNDVESFSKATEIGGANIACVIMEPVRSSTPDEKFLNKVRRFTCAQEIPLIIDEVTAGFRLRCGGAHRTYGIDPDMAVYAKALGNGFPIATVVGKKNIMNSAQDTFISSTMWTEATGVAAALATIRKYRDCQVHKHLETLGRSVKEIWTKYAVKHSIDIRVSGIDPLAHFDFNHKSSQALMTKYTRDMLDRGILAGSSFYSTYSHSPEDLELFESAVNDVFEGIATVWNAPNEHYEPQYPVKHSGFERLT